MSLRIALLAAAVAFILPAQAQYPKQGVRFLSQIALADMPGAPTSGAGCASYVSPSGQEYAIMGVRNGTLFVRITNPAAPVIVGHIPGVISTWHEMTTLGEYCYSVADGSGTNQGVQVIDLRQIDQGIVSLAATYHGNGLSRVHTIQANPESKTIYLNGSNLGFVALDARNPVNLVEVGRWTTKYVHDCVVRTFTGAGFRKEVAFLFCAGSDLYIIDVTKKAAISTLSNVQYLAGSNYSHSGSLSADGRTIFAHDEFDESNGLVPNCTTHLIDVSSLTAPVYLGQHNNPIQVIDHNSNMRGNWLFLAAYRGGVRVYDASNPLNLVETGYFDTYPSGQGYSYTGAWGTMAGYPSGNIIVSDINRGLFVLDPSEALGLGAPLLEANVAMGTLSSGGVGDIRLDDDRELVAQPTRKGIRLDVVAESSVTPASFLDVRVVVNAPAVSVRIDLYNWTTGTYQQVGTFGVSPASPMGEKLGLSAANYVNASGRIQSRIWLTPGDIGSDPIHVDQVRFVVRRP